MKAAKASDSLRCAEGANEHDKKNVKLWNPTA
jgi:hypothetical protein